MDFYQCLLFAGSFVLSAQLLPQNYKIYKTKSTKDISYISLFLTKSGVISFLIYGIHFNILELWVPPIFQLFITTHTLAMKIYYDNYYKHPEIIIKEEVDISLSSHVTIGIRINSIDNLGYE